MIKMLQGPLREMFYQKILWARNTLQNPPREEETHQTDKLRAITCK